MTKKEILEKLKKTYKRTTNRIFSEDCHIFNNHDFTCQLTLNPDKTLTITVKAELCSTNAQETRDNVTISYGYPDDPDPLTILFDIETTVNTPEELPQLFIDLANELNDVKEKEKLC